MTRSDHSIVNLQENLAQAWLTIEWLEEETVPQQRYQELQRQLRDMNALESETLDKYRRVKERIEKIKLRLEKAMNQMDIICSLYTDILACRYPTNNYVLFFMER